MAPPEKSMHQHGMAHSGDQTSARGIMALAHSCVTAAARGSIGARHGALAASGNQASA